MLKNRDVNTDLLASIAKCFTFRIQYGTNAAFFKGFDPFYLVLISGCV